MELAGECEIVDLKAKTRDDVLVCSNLTLRLCVSCRLLRGYEAPPATLGEQYELGPLLSNSLLYECRSPLYHLVEIFWVFVEISVSHGCEYEVDCLPGCSAV